MNNYATHSLKHVGRGEPFDLSTLQLTNSWKISRFYMQIGVPILPHVMNMRNQE